MTGAGNPSNKSRRYNMAKRDWESVVWANLFALAINHSEFSPTTQAACTVAVSFYSLIKIFNP